MSYDFNHFKSSYSIWNIQAGCTKKAVGYAPFLMTMGIYSDVKKGIASTRGIFLRRECTFPGP